ncbi:hypothetical protein ILYODFUR_035320 [Ilyodon furcidens]|uniref:Uncharacterized protein n=1 Tax=Ilyodon furcidens TaxID=33524 RepID=A0ABV0V8S8_9TELE
MPTFISSGHRARDTDTHRTDSYANTHAPRGNLKKPINTTVMFIGCGRNPQFPARTHACTGITCKLHAESSFLLQGYNATNMQSLLHQLGLNNLLPAEMYSSMQ